jgi:glutaredoxin
MSLLLPLPHAALRHARKGSETEDIQLEKRLTRREAASYVTATYGIRLSPRTLENTPVPYIVVNGQAIYETKELDRYARDKIAVASRRMGRVAQTREALSAAA